MNLLKAHLESLFVIDLGKSLHPPGITWGITSDTSHWLFRAKVDHSLFKQKTVNPPCVGVFCGPGKQSLPDLLQVGSGLTMGSLLAKRGTLTYLGNPVKSTSQLLFSSGHSLIIISSPLYCELSLICPLEKWVLHLAINSSWWGP